MDENLAIWTLAGIDGIGPTRLKQIIGKFGSALEVFEKSTDLLLESKLVSRDLAVKIAKIKNWELQETEFEKSFPPRAQYVSLTQTEYPSKLKEISDPPPYFYYKGKLELFEGPSLAVVGSRRPTDYGKRITSRIVGELASAGVLIVSGLAYGIDGIAHQAALEAGGKTVAVFGCGLDIVYPPGHKALADRIAESGCLISEFPRGTKPEQYNFPMRNRIIAGLCDGVLVIEASQKSGALITAGLGLEQGRDVLAIPGSVENEFSFGPNELIKQGAIPVTSESDIFSNFGWHKSKAMERPTAGLADLNANERLILEKISIEPVHLDELGRRTGVGPGRIAEVLLNLEIKGYIMRRPGNYVVKA